MQGGGYNLRVSISLGTLLPLDEGGANLIGESFGGEWAGEKESVLLGCHGTNDMANGM